jgi:TetR/AcrR family transcriptional repressor of lmrAB and yxaGH operons
LSAAPKHRDAIVNAAATLFRRHGYAATGLNDIVEESGAPKGSLYHYFPNGKDAIGAAAVTYAGARVTKTLQDLAQRHAHAGALVKAYGALLAGWMEKSGFRDGCPITTTLLETAPQSKDILKSGETAFAQWRAILADALRRDGVAKPQALARFALSAMEGSLILSRAEQSAQPITEAAAELARAFRNAAKT